MNYEQKYKEALERARKIENGEPLDVPDGTSIPMAIFPELKESEDERIKKRLTDLLRKIYISTDYITHTEHEEILHWLEKQGEHRSVWHDDSDEPIRGSLILLIMQSGTPVVAKIIEPNHTFNHGERWAYIDDLIKL